MEVNMEYTGQKVLQFKEPLRLELIRKPQPKLTKKERELEQAILITTTEGTSTSGVFLIGPKGTGKTTSVKRILEDNGRDYVVFSGKVTPLGLYNFLKDHSKDIIVLDDVEGIENPASISLLKSVLGRDKNGNATTINYAIRDHTYSFRFEGSLIVITNALKAQKEHLEAVLDRMLIINYEFTQEEIFDKMKDICLYNEYRTLNHSQELRIYNFIKESWKQGDNFSLRTLTRAFDAFVTLGDSWQEYVKQMISESRKGIL
jgi:hypothetical protein